jgi:orotate phosphoribosyltransferase
MEIVESLVIRLARTRSGHFDLGTGYHGDVWLDLDALFLRPAMLRPHVRRLADRLLEHQLDAVCGPAEGGAFLALAIADVLGTAFLPAHRDPDPGSSDATGYRLPAVRGGIAGWRVAVVDDAINAGTAVRTCYRRALVEGCWQLGVLPEAYSSLGIGHYLSNRTVLRVAQRAGRTPAQVLLRWCLQHNLVVIPKSTHRERIRENGQIFDFVLSGEDMAELDGLDTTKGTDRAFERRWWAPFREAAGRARRRLAHGPAASGS